MTSKQRDLVAALLFVAVALLLLLFAIPYGVTEPKKVKFAALNPSYYPRIISYCLLCIGVILLTLRTVIKPTNQSSKVLEKEPTGVKPLRLVWMAGIFAFYYLSLPMLGFVVSSSIVLVLLLLTAGESSPWVLISLPIVLPFGLYYFFVKVANIPIPAGLLESMLVGS